MTQEQLKARTKQIALRVMELVDALPKTASRNRQSQSAIANPQFR